MLQDMYSKLNKALGAVKTLAAGAFGGDLGLMGPFGMLTSAAAFDAALGGSGSTGADAGYALGGVTGVAGIDLCGGLANGAALPLDVGAAAGSTVVALAVDVALAGPMLLWLALVWLAWLWSLVWLAPHWLHWLRMLLLLLLALVCLAWLVWLWLVVDGLVVVDVASVGASSCWHGEPTLGLSISSMVGCLYCWLVLLGLVVFLKWGLGLEKLVLAWKLVLLGKAALELPGQFLVVTEVLLVKVLLGFLSLVYLDWVGWLEGWLAPWSYPCPAWCAVIVGCLGDMVEMQHECTAPLLGQPWFPKHGQGPTPLKETYWEWCCCQ